MSHAFHAQKRKEKFYKLAKEQGYRSRAAFKLIQLNKKFGFLSSSRACLDLCAAPGGWLQIASKYMPVGSLIIGVDLLPIKPIQGVITFVDDILTQSCRSQIRQNLHGWQVDLVLHDGAPNVGGGGSWTRDAYQQTELVLHSLKLATEFLVEGGTFVTKIFRSQDYIALCWVLKQFFKKVEVTKPVSSRQASAEIFAVCLGYLAPKKIDPKLFDPAVVFKPAPVEEKTPNVMTMKQKRPNREGYETENQILFKRASVSEFLNEDNPSVVLASCNEMYFDEDAEMYKSHKATTGEILELIKDLKVLGKGDFAALIRWHRKLRKHREDLANEQQRLADAAAAQARRARADGAEDGEGEEEVDSEALVVSEADKLDMELAELKTKMSARQLKEKRKKHEMLQKQAKRLVMSERSQTALKGTDVDDTLFALKSINSDDSLQMLTDENGQVSKVLGKDKFTSIISSHYNENEDISDLSAEDLSDDSEVDPTDKAAYLEKANAAMEKMYDEYRKRKNIQMKRDKKKMGLDDDELAHALQEEEASADEERDEGAGDGDYIDKVRAKLNKGKEHTSLLSESGPSGSAVAGRWFAQDAFADVDMGDDEDDEEEEEEVKDVRGDRRKTAQAAASAKLSQKRRRDDDSDDDDEEEEEEEEEESDEADDDGDDDDEEEEEEEEELPKPKGKHSKQQQQQQQRPIRSYSDSESDSDEEEENGKDSDAQFAKNRWLAVDEQGRSLAKGRKGIEAAVARNAAAAEALAAKNKKKGGSSSSSSGFEEVAAEDYSDDSDAIAETLAIGTKMLRQKQRNAIIDSAYNRYAYNDHDELPDWFVDDENKHNKAQLPVTKAEVDAIKQQLKALNARPIRKVAEARARKKAKALRKLERMKLQANSIANQDGVSSAEKMKQIEKLYRTTRAKQKLKPQKHYVVSSRGGASTTAKSKTKGQGKFYTIRVDSRMKKDKRGADMAKMRKDKSTKLRNKKKHRQA